ncbi:hypothetical protein PACTADRAFT_38733 [Pachysolen tannophilus NRRL Y-2460]|uniref:F-box domain-containing protein n=1 Tax=Pachysolen tannophilus NRRL Y-2460 TaxID=669874 RepID=A0A1E4TZB3_PACTA|nr:hypothetical protein PACTADRAFT_38733 [Pachysolen tannophilus NRRL Y-2460]
MAGPENRIQFLDLGADIIVSNLVPNLSPKDIRALSLTCHRLNSLTQESSIVWHELFKKTFGANPTPFTLSEYKWPDLFKMRKSAKLMTWGKAEGRLGYSVRDIPTENVARKFFNTAVVKPTVVKNFKEIILADVTAGGFSFQVLSSEGNLYSTGVNWHGGLRTGPGPDVDDFFPQDLILRAQHDADNTSQQLPPLPRDNLIHILPIGNFRRGGRIFPPMPTNRIQPEPGPEPEPEPEPEPAPEPAPEARHLAPTPTRAGASENVSLKDGFIRKMEIPTKNKIVSISSGRAHFIALDDTGSIWTWDNPRQHNIGIKLKFMDPQTNVNLINERNIVTKIVAGWNISCCYILNVGIVIWFKRDSLKNNEPRDTAVNAHFKIVKDTGDLYGASKVIDFMAGESFIVFITAEGKLYKMDCSNPELLDTERPYPLNKFNQYLAKHSQVMSFPAKFKRLSGTFKTFAAFSDEDHVLIGHKDSNDNVTVIKELQHKHCISVAVGDYHFLALLRNGDLLSWGLESQFCGCLGLGDSENIVSKYHGEVNGRSGVRVNVPSKVDVNGGEVLAIAAAGWQSCAIVSFKD